MIVPSLKGEKQRNIRYTKGPFDCNSSHVIYLFECKQCQYCLPYVGSNETKFRYRTNNYISTHQKFRK